MPDTAFTALGERAAYDGAAEIATEKSGEAAPLRLALSKLMDSGEFAPNLKIDSSFTHAAIPSATVLGASQITTAYNPSGGSTASSNVPNNRHAQYLVAKPLSAQVRSLVAAGWKVRLRFERLFATGAARNWEIFAADTDGTRISSVLNRSIGASASPFEVEIDQASAINAEAGQFSVVFKNVSGGTAAGVRYRNLTSLSLEIEPRSGLDSEAVRDLVADFIEGGDNVDVEHDDASDQLKISLRNIDVSKDGVGAYGGLAFHIPFAIKAVIADFDPEQALGDQTRTAPAATADAPLPDDRSVAFVFDCPKNLRDAINQGLIMRFGMKLERYTDSAPGLNYTIRSTLHAADGSQIKQSPRLFLTLGADFDSQRNIVEDYVDVDLDVNSAAGEMALVVASSSTATPVAKVDISNTRLWLSFAGRRSGTEDATARAAAAAAQATADAALAAAGSGTPDARVERINFSNVANGNSDAEASPSEISVVNGAGEASILSAITDNDFTVAAGVYLVNIHGNFDFANQQTYAGFAIRRASDNAELDQSNAIFTRSINEVWSARILLVLSAATAVNLLVKRNGNVSIAALHAEFVQLSAGGDVRSPHNRYVGWAAQQTPSSAEITAGATFTSDVLTIPDPDPGDTIDPDDEPGWLWFAVPDDAGAPTAAYFDGNTHDILGGFTQLASGTFAGHIVYATNAEQDPAILGTGSRTLTLEYS